MEQKACRFRSVEACTFDGTPCPFCSSEVREKECELRVLSVLETFPQEAGASDRVQAIAEMAPPEKKEELTPVLAGGHGESEDSLADAEDGEEVSIDSFL